MRTTILLFFLFVGLSYGQYKTDSIQFRNISNEIILNGEAYDNLYDLTQNIGHRLSGSESLDRAILWAEKKLKEAGADKVWLQEVMVPHWVRGEESLKMMVGNGQWQEMNFLSLGNSEGTGGKDVEGEVIRVETIEEFEALPDSKVKGKVVFFDYKFPQEYIYTMEAYGQAFKYRAITASLVAKKGGKFVIVRSTSTGIDDTPHTGAMWYDEKYPKIPAVTIGNFSADHLAKMLANEKVTLKLNSNCGMQGEILSYNVIGEITGKKDDKVIVVGGHIDSWDVGEGAHDDGAGIVQSIEVIRAFRALGIQNNHTIRAVCYTNEENGARGGVKYAEEARDKNELHLFAIESDAGGFSPRGIALDMEESKRKQIQSWASLFLPYGVYDFSFQHGGVDVDPLKRISGVPVGGLLPDSQRYFDIHHSAEDTFEKVNKRELHLGAVAMAQLIYLLDKYW